MIKKRSKNFFSSSWKERSASKTLIFSPWGNWSLKGFINGIFFCQSHRSDRNLHDGRARLLRREIYSEHLQASLRILQTWTRLQVKRSKYFIPFKLTNLIITFFNHFQDVEQEEIPNSQTATESSSYFLLTSFFVASLFFHWLNFYGTEQNTEREVIGLKSPLWHIPFICFHAFRAMVVTRIITHATERNKLREFELYFKNWFGKINFLGRARLKMVRVFLKTSFIFVFFRNFVCSSWIIFVM